MTQRSSLRLFIALALPAQTRDLLHSWGREALVACSSAAAGPPTRQPSGSAEAEKRRSRRGRWSERATGRLLAAELQHLTISFLGTSAPELLRPLCELVEGLQLPPAERAMLSCAGPLWLPRRRPRALAVQIHSLDQWLDRLHADVLAAVGALAGSTAHPAHRAGSAPGGGLAQASFRAHVTVARFPRGAAQASGPLPATPAHSFSPSALGLYRSQLLPTGAAYELLAAGHPPDHRG